MRGGEPAGKPKDRVAWAMAGVALLFFLKSATLALFVTPLWDVPDEIGHLALVRDIAEGRGLARAGVSVLPDDLVARWRPEQAAGGPVFNWVAQHPPLYHLLAVPFLAAGRLASDEEQMRDRAPRLLSALSGAAALWVFFLLLREASRDALLAFAAASSVAFLPMWTHMSSGTNHDVLLGLILAVAALFFVRLVEAGSFGDAVAMGAALSLAGVTKLSALAVALPLLLVTGRHLASRGARRVWQWAATAVMALALPALWALRHRLLSVASPLHVTSGDPLSLSGLASYLRSNPVIDHTFKNFIGLIGWTGTGGGEVAWFQISGVFLAPFLLLAIALSVGTILWLAAGSPASRVRRASALASVAALASLTILAAPTSGGALAKGLVYALLVATSVFALTWMLRPRNSDDATVAESHFVLLAFAAAYLVNSWQAFRITGEMRATNGRYFFAVLPFLLLAFFLPAFRAWAQRFPARLLLGVPLVLAVNEAAFFAVRVLPFYRG